MDLSLILASTVVAAIVSGLFALYQNYRNNKIKKITDERKAWRDDIREIAKKIVSCDDKEIIVEIASLKVKLNAYGNTDKYNDAYLRKINNQKMVEVKESYICRIVNKIKNRKIIKRERNDNIELIQYYKSDCHIWKLIHRMEKENNYNDKNILIEYLSFLLKYDWERSKVEIIFDRQFMFSVFLFFCSLGSVFLLETYYYSGKNGIAITNIITSFITFTMCFLCSLIPRYDLFNKMNYDKHKASGYFIVPIFIILLVMAFLVIAVFFNKTDGLYFFPFILLLVSLVLNYESFIKLNRRREKYRDLLLEYDIKNIENKAK